MIRNGYLVKFSNGTYLAPRVGGRRFYKPETIKKQTTFNKARIFSTRKSAEMSAILIPNAKVVEVYITEVVFVREKELV